MIASPEPTTRALAQQYMAAGFALCAIKPGNKGPTYKKWDQHPLTLEQINTQGLGLIHAKSGTCAIDLDDLGAAAAWLDAHGIDLAELLAADDAVQITSGRPNRGKLLYRLPAGVDPLPTVKVKAPDGAMMLELRCATSSAVSDAVQDVLPPTIHPDTGQPYRWAGAGSFEALPELPAALLALWRAQAGRSSTTTTAAPMPAPAGVIGEGSRNDTLFRMGGDLARHGLPAETIEAALHQVNEAQCRPPLARHEVATIARSASVTSHGARERAIAEQVDISGLLAGLAGGDTFSLDQFALNGQSQEMRAKMLDDVHILGRLALLGQLTAFYTERNGGKTLLTLWLLIDAIRRGTINPKDVYYINSDDTHKGLVEKTEIAERYGFTMMADGYQEFKNSMLVAALDKLVKSDQARGKIIILDTLKKFTDVMNKRESSDFMTALRSFVLQGGSVIMLAHVNKHRDENGKLVFSGTTDVVDDADCAYLMDKVARNGRTIVTFDNFKARGDVAEKAVYSFERNPDGGQTYAQLLDTVQPVGEEELQRAREAARVAAQVGENAKIIASVLDAIGEGITKRTELIEAVHASTGESKRRVIHTLDAHTGSDFLAGARWQIVKGDKNAKVYQGLPLFSSFSGKEGVGSEKLKN